MHEPWGVHTMFSVLPVMSSGRHLQEEVRRELEKVAAHLDGRNGGEGVRLKDGQKEPGFKGLAGTHGVSLTKGKTAPTAGPASPSTVSPTRLSNLPCRGKKRDAEG
jgi:hypothetical protein